ncbi:polysialyltransferase family glycosyltransferase [Streptomyces sp. NPDC002644]
MTTQIFLASTLYGTATLAAALDAGCFGTARRRILLVSNNAAVPETTPAPSEAPGFEKLRERFDEVVSWNDTISPFHPSGWEPRPEDAVLWQRHLRLAWDLGDDDVELAVESIQAQPSLGIAQIFGAAPLTVYADGLMSYGPTRIKLDPLVGTRVTRLLHLDLVPGLRPLLLTEFGVPAELVPTDAFLKVLDELATGQEGLPEVPGSPALLLGQYLAALNILTPAEEEQLHLRMVRGAVALGHRTIVFKPHPTAPASWNQALVAEAERLGVELTVLDEPMLAEVLFRRLRPALVAGCFSTALFTASALHGLPVARTGTTLLLDRLAPYQNSNRVPVTVVDALLPDLEDAEAVREQRPGMTVEQLGELVTAVGFAMQARIHPALRPAAEAFLREHQDPRWMRYFKRRRLTSLGLPGGVPDQLTFLARNRALKRAVRRARSLKRTLRR